MATGTVATTARKYHEDMVHYLVAPITFTDTAAITVGILPAGALIIKPTSGLMTLTAFNAATTNNFNIGSTADDDRFATLIAGGAVGFVGVDENDLYVSADTTVTATYVPSGAAATTGSGYITIAYVMANRAA